jgi:tryptophan synthase alpha chain
MMGRIAALFTRLKRPAFIGFTVAGDPDKETCIRAAMALIEGGTDILELGVPFSDPVADGPTIQKADERSLGAGTKVDTVFEIVHELRKKTDVPLVFLVYYNMVYHRGVDRFYRDAHEVGVDGILIADMPVEESDDVYETALRYRIDPIFLITQTTSDDRIKKIVARAQGYLYLVAVLGVTGVRIQFHPARSNSSDGSGNIQRFPSLSDLAYRPPTMRRSALRRVLKGSLSAARLSILSRETWAIRKQWRRT